MEIREMDEIIYAIKVADLSYSGLKVLDVKIGQTTNIKNTLTQYRRSHRSVEILNLWESNRSKTLSDCEKGIHKIAEKYSYEREAEKFIFLQESYEEFSRNVNLLLRRITEQELEREETTFGSSKYDTIDYTGTRPKLIKFKNKEYEVNSWRDVLHTVARMIYESKRDFSLALNIRGAKRDYFSEKASNLVDPVEIKGSPYFFEGNISANLTMRIIEKLLDVFNYDKSDLEVVCK